MTMTQPFALIIENDSYLGWVFDLPLQLHFTTEIVNNSSAAFKRLEKTIPTLIVLDLDLPGTGCTDILHLINTDSRFRSTNLFLCTSDPHQAEALRDKADLVLKKPVSLFEFREIVAHFINFECAPNSMLKA
jgi:CheY-like chemotaxis protein